MSERTRLLAAVNDEPSLNNEPSYDIAPSATSAKLSSSRQDLDPSHATNWGSFAGKACKDGLQSEIALGVCIRDWCTVTGSSDSDFQTIINIVKATVGAGSFVLPYCMKQMGLVPGVMTIVLLGIASVFTTLMLIRSKDMVYAHSGLRDVNYVNIADHTFGKPGAATVYGLMLLASLGVAASYLVFIGDVMNEVVPAVSVGWWKAIPLVILIPVSWLRTLKQLSYTSVVGSVALVAAMIVTVAYGFRDELEHFKSFEPTYFNWDTYFSSFGSVAFLFCIQFLVLPIERAMKQHERFPRVLSISFFIISFSNIAFAVICYFFWGEATLDIILSNMKEDVLTDIVKGFWCTRGYSGVCASFGITVVSFLVCVCLDLLFTYPLVFAPGCEIVERFLLNPEHRYIDWQRNLVRTVLVLCTFALAQIQQFSVITNLVGIPMTVLAYVMPPLMELRLLGFGNVSKLKLTSYVSLAVIGMMICIVTTVFSFLGSE